MTWTASMIVALVACLLMYGLALALLVWTVKVDRARLVVLEARGRRGDASALGGSAGGAGRGEPRPAALVKGPAAS